MVAAPAAGKKNVPPNPLNMWQPATSWIKPIPKAMYEPVSAITESISSKVKEKYASNESLMEQRLMELNNDMFWARYGTLEDLSRIEKKDDIIRIINTFLFISKKSIYLFSNYSRKIIANRDFYSANELGQIANAFAQLGYLDEAFCSQIAARVVADVAHCSSGGLVNLIDAYASTRCYMEPVVDALCASAESKISNFTSAEVSLFSSSLARLNVRNETLFAQLSDRFVCDESEPKSARDLTLAAYAFAKMKIPVTAQFQASLIAKSKELIRDFTAKELQMLTTALDRWEIQDVEIFKSISGQAQRRMAQFSADALILMLRAFASRKVIDEALTTRVVCQLPRLAPNLKNNEVVGFLTAFKELGTESQIVSETLAPLVVTQGGQFNPSDWAAVAAAANSIGTNRIKQETIDALNLVSAYPPKYKATGAVVYKTVLARMTDSQFIDLLRDVRGMMSEEVVTTNLENTMFLQLENQRLPEMTSSQASDTYCALVALNVHEDPVRSDLMKRIFAKAITNPQ